MNKHDIRLTEVGEQVIRQLFNERVIQKENKFSIKTRKGMMEDDDKETLFWDWLAYCKTL